MATPFGGGVGRSEDICGALSGGILAIGVALGRSELTEDRLRSYDAARELHDWFEKQFESTECATLSKGDFKSPEHRTRCGRYIEETTRKAALILKEPSA
jgi:C_GCAxxG_C_C family probable redox protein